MANAKNKRRRLHLENIQPAASSPPQLDSHPPPPSLLKSSQQFPPAAVIPPAPSAFTDLLPPTSPPLPPTPISFDVPFTLLDDDIVASPTLSPSHTLSKPLKSKPSPSTRPTSDTMSAAAEAFHHSLSAPLQPPTIPPLTSSTAIPSSFPISPSSSAPTSVNAPAGEGGGEGQLLTELSALADKQRERKAGDEESAERKEGEGKGKGRAKRKKAGGKGKAEGKLSSFIDKTNAGDIRAFMKGMSSQPPLQVEAEGQSPVKSALWTQAAPQVDIDRLLAHFAKGEQKRGRERSDDEVKKMEEEKDVLEPSEDADIETQGPIEKKEGRPLSENPSFRISGARKATELSDEPSDGNVEELKEQETMEEEQKKEEEAEDGEMKDVPASLLLTSSPQSAVQPLERANTIIASNTCPDSPAAPTPPLSTFSSFSFPHPLRSRGSSKLHRLHSLSSTTSSTSTVSRLSSPPPSSPPCEHLPSLLPSYHSQSLTLSLSPSSSLSAVACTTAGHWRPMNQDAFSLSSYPTSSPFAVLGLFDGHGSLGENASSLCAEMMGDKLAALLLRGKGEEKAMMETFESAQKLLLSVARAEQAEMAVKIRKYKPDLNVVASTSCVSIAASSPPSPVTAELPDSSDSSTLSLEIPPPPMLTLTRAVREEQEIKMSAPDSRIHMTDDSSKVEAEVKEDVKEEAMQTNESLKVEEEGENTDESSSIGKGQGKKRKRRKLLNPRKRSPRSPASQPASSPQQEPTARPISPITITPHIPSTATSSLLLPIKRSPIKRTVPHATSPSQPARLSRSALPYSPLPSTIAVDMDYGTTGLLLLASSSSLVFANCGDSRAVVFEWKAEGERAPLSPPVNPRRHSVLSRSFSSPSSSFSSALPSPFRILYQTVDHDPSLPLPCSTAEASRVHHNGGSLYSLPGQHRLYPSLLSFAEARSRALTLNMSRALGHNLLSQHGVDWRPDVGRVEGGREGMRWVVMGSDGLWDVMGVEEVMQEMEREVGEQRGRKGCKGRGEDGICLECICCQLIAVADGRWMARGSGDNITVIIARITK